MAMTKRELVSRLGEHLSRAIRQDLASLGVDLGTHEPISDYGPHRGDDVMVRFERDSACRGWLCHFSVFVGDDEVMTAVGQTDSAEVPQ